MSKNSQNQIPDEYALDQQVGFLLRRANQRHLAIYSKIIAELTPTQFAVLAKLFSRGPLSQNALGRETAMDAATIKGVVDRLVARNLLTTERDETDKRRTIVSLTSDGLGKFQTNVARASDISAKTLEPLSENERIQFLNLLSRLS